MGDDRIRINWDDLKDPKVDAELQRQKPPMAAPLPAPSQPPSDKDYGTVVSVRGPSTAARGIGRTWFYMAVAGLIGACLAWAVAEVGLAFASASATGISPIVQAIAFFAIAGACIGGALCSVEGFTGRNFQNAIIGCLIGGALGLVGGGIAGGLGQAIYGGWGHAEQQNIMLLADTSGSMTGAPLEELKTSAKSFVRTNAGRQVAFGIVSFGTESRKLSPLTDSNTTIIDAIDRLQTSGGTNMLDGIRDADDLLLGKQGKNAILFFTDGAPTTKPDLIDKCVKAAGLTDQEWMLLLYKYFSLPSSERAFGPESGSLKIEGDERPTASEKTLVEAVLSDALKQTREQTVSEAERCRAMGTRVVAVGTGEADRDFLGRLAGSPANVLFADPGQLSVAFAQAQKILFREEQTSLSAKSVLTRGLCWAIAGMLLASGQGIVMRSGKKTRNALIGGLIGGLVGGLLFDPASSAFSAGWAGRGVALGIIGVATGTMVGVVEGLLKESWLQVVAGKLARKQFVIYRNPTIIGSAPKCDIYLFKDPAITPQHAAISSTANRYYIEDLSAGAGTFVNGYKIGRQALRSGDQIRVGDTVFVYSERVSHPAPVT